MKRASNLFLPSMLICLCLPGALRAQRADIAQPQAREAVVDRAQELAQKGRGNVADWSEKNVNPFDPEGTQGKLAGGGREAPPPARKPEPEVLSDAQQLERLMKELRPTGTIFLGGEAYLLFGQKKIKTGQEIPIAIEGTLYRILLTDVQRTQFTVRFGTAEAVHPIKP